MRAIEDSTDAMVSEVGAGADIAACALKSTSSGPRHPSQITTPSRETAAKAITPKTKGRERVPRKASATSPTRSEAGSKPEACGFSTDVLGAEEDAPCGCD